MKMRFLRNHFMRQGDGSKASNVRNLEPFPRTWSSAVRVRSAPMNRKKHQILPAKRKFQFLQMSNVRVDFAIYSCAPVTKLEVTFHLASWWVDFSPCEGLREGMPTVAHKYVGRHSTEVWLKWYCSGYQKTQAIQLRNKNIRTHS